MEVHSHTHTARKKWTHYFWEFLMLFLAVFCGFLAENIREHSVERHREKEFAQALYTELLADSAAVATKLGRRLDKEKDMDYLSSYFKDSSLTNLPKNVYPAYTISFFLINSYSFEPKDGILSQLRNSGSLRYFKSIVLQKLLGDISVNINEVRTRNEQEYQFFANPIRVADFVAKTKQFAAVASADDLLLPFLATINELTIKFGHWQIPWGEINRFQRISSSIDNKFDDSKPSIPDGFVSSAWGMLPSYSSRTFPGTKKRYGVNGNSFICAVEFGKRIKAKSLLAGGESGDSNSKHFFDQGSMYSKGQFKDVLFYKEDVLKHAEKSYHPGE